MSWWILSTAWWYHRVDVVRDALLPHSTKKKKEKRKIPFLRKLVTVCIYGNNDAMHRTRLKKEKKATSGHEQLQQPLIKKKLNTMFPIKLEKSHCKWLQYCTCASLQAVVYCHGGRVGFYQGDIRLLPDDMKTLRPTIFPVVPRLLNRMYDKVSTRKVQVKRLCGLSKNPSTVNGKQP